MYLRPIKKKIYISEIPRSSPEKREKKEALEEIQ
jgi:hypothetical protein